MWCRQTLPGHSSAPAEGPVIKTMRTGFIHESPILLTPMGLPRWKTGSCRPFPLRLLRGTKRSLTGADRASPATTERRSLPQGGVPCPAPCTPGPLTTPLMHRARREPHSGRPRCPSLALAPGTLPHDLPLPMPPPRSSRPRWHLHRHLLSVCVPSRSGPPWTPPPTGTSHAGCQRTRCGTQNGGGGRTGQRTERGREGRSQRTGRGRQGRSSRTRRPARPTPSRSPEARTLAGVRSAAHCSSSCAGFVGDGAASATLCGSAPAVRGGRGRKVTVPWWKATHLTGPEPTPPTSNPLTPITAAERHSTPPGSGGSGPAGREAGGHSPHEPCPPAPPVEEAFEAGHQVLRPRGQGTRQGRREPRWGGQAPVLTGPPGKAERTSLCAQCTTGSFGRRRSAGPTVNPADRGG